MVEQLELTEVDTKVTLVSNDKESSQLDSSYSENDGICTGASSFIERKKRLVRKAQIILIMTVFIGYLALAMTLNFYRSMPLWIPAILVGLLLVISKFHYVLSSRVSFSAGTLQPSNGESNLTYKIREHLGCVIIVLWFAIICVYVLFDAVSARNIQPVAGIIVFLIAMLFCSKNIRRVNWKTVVGGLSLQFSLALLSLRTSFGYNSFRAVGAEVTHFLKYADHGSKFVFGDQLVSSVFAFQVLPVIIFFSCVVSVLYYVGVMQKIIAVLAFVMRNVMQTSGPESVSCAGNIFVGQTEAPILVRPFLSRLTMSELHAIMTGGFATVAGGVLMAYVSFGVRVENLLCASLMNAPAALLVSKLLYPEIEEPKCNPEDSNGCEITEDDLPKHRNIIDAAADGASSAIFLVANVAANLIAFIGVLRAFNAAIAWLGSLVNVPNLSFQLVCSYVFLPVAYLMGVPWSECGLVAQLIGTRMILNEFVAYKDLAEHLAQGNVTARTETIATFALCGFANLTSISVQIGGLAAIAPTRRGDLSALAFRAMLAGTMATFLSACIAGILVSPVNQVSLTTAMLNGTSTIAVTNFTEIL